MAKFPADAPKARVIALEALGFQIVRERAHISCFGKIRTEPKHL